MKSHLPFNGINNRLYKHKWIRRVKTSIQRVSRHNISIFLFKTKWARWLLFFIVKVSPPIKLMSVWHGHLYVLHNTRVALSAFPTAVNQTHSSKLTQLSLISCPHSFQNPLLQKISEMGCKVPLWMLDSVQVHSLMSDTTTDNHIVIIIALSLIDWFALFMAINETIEMTKQRDACIFICSFISQENFVIHKTSVELYTEHPQH